MSWTPINTRVETIWINKETITQFLNEEQTDGLLIHALLKNWNNLKASSRPLFALVQFLTI